MIKNKLIIFPSATPWDWTADFLRQTALVLAKNNQIIVYDQLRAHFFAQRKMKQIYPQLKNIKFVQPQYFIPGRRWTLIENINRQLSFWLLLFKHRHQEKIVWFFEPEHHYLAHLKVGRTLSLYDCVDFHSATSLVEESKRIANNEVNLIKQVDYFFVNSDSLKTIHQSMLKNKKIHRLKAQGFCPPLNKLNTAQIERNKTLTLGYVGGINHRLDFQLIYALAINNPDWQIILIGPKQSNSVADKKYQTNRCLKKISQLKNVQLQPAKKRQELFKSIASFDWAIIPYKTELDYNRYSYPMKVFEYLYCGKKILSTPIEELKKPQFKSVIYIAETAQDWQKIVKEYSSKIDLNINLCQKLALKNTWTKKIEEISAIIN